MRGFGTKPAATKPGARPAFGFGAKAESPRPPKVETVKPTLAEDIADPETEPLQSDSAFVAAVLSVGDSPSSQREVPNLAAPTMGEEESSEATLARPPAEDMIERSRPVDQASADHAGESLNLPPPPPLAEQVELSTHVEQAHAETPLDEPTHADARNDRAHGEMPPAAPLHAEPSQLAEPPHAVEPSPATPGPVLTEPAAPKPAVSADLPAFSAGSGEDAPSKFVATAPPPAKRGFAWVVVVVLVIVVGTLAFLYMRRQAQVQTTTPPTPTATAKATVTATATATAAAAATATAGADASGAAATPSGSASAAVSAGASDSPPTDPKTLEPTKGYLYVESPKPDASVFLFTTNLGPVNTWIETPCKKNQFVRPGKAAAAGPEWVAAGKAVDVPCQGAIKVTIP